VRVPNARHWKKEIINPLTLGKPFVINTLPDGRAAPEAERRRIREKKALTGENVSVIKCGFAAEFFATEYEPAGK